MKQLALFFLLSSIHCFSFAQVNNHPLNNPLYRDIAKHHLNLNNHQINDAITIDNFLATLQRNKQLSSDLRKYTDFNIPSDNPEVLIKEYQYKKSELDAECSMVKAEIESRLTRDLNLITRSIERELNKRGVNTRSTGSKIGDVYLKATKESLVDASKETIMEKKKRQIDRARKEAERELDSILNAKLLPIKHKMLSENESASTRYKQAFIYAIDKNDEEKYLDNYLYYQCRFDHINTNYSIENVDWITPPCYAPKYGDITKSNHYDFIKAARRKYELYREYGFPELLDITKEYLEFGVGEDPYNANAHLLKAEISNDIIDKLFSIKIATHLNSQDKSILNKRSEIETSFKQKLREAIIANNTAFLLKSIEKGVIYDVRIDELTALEYAISIDNSASMSLLLVNGYEHIVKDYLQLTTIISRSPKCLNTLFDKFNVAKDIKLNSAGMTLLNLVIDNEGDFFELYLNDNSLRNSLDYIKTTSDKKEDLLKICGAAYIVSDAYLSVIEEYFPNYTSNYLVETDFLINTEEFEVLVDDRLISLNSDKLILPKQDTYHFRILSNDKQGIAFELPTNNNRKIRLEVNLPDRLKTDLSEEFNSLIIKTWEDYFIPPNRFINHETFFSGKIEKYKKEIEKLKIEAEEMAAKVNREQIENIYSKIKRHNDKLLAETSIVVSYNNNELIEPDYSVINYNPDNIKSTFTVNEYNRLNDTRNSSTIRISRVKAFNSAAGKIRIYIDGKFAGKLKNNSSMEIRNVPFGKHRISESRYTKYGLHFDTSPSDPDEYIYYKCYDCDPKKAESKAFGITLFKKIKLKQTLDYNTL